MRGARAAVALAAALATILAGWTVAHPAGTDGPSDGTPAPMLESPGRPECCRDDVQASLDPPSVGLEADVSQLPRQWRIDTHPVLAPDGSQIGTQDWRVVHGTGNCCENYLASSADGSLFDLGGGRLWVSADGGASWQRVSTEEPVEGEGAVAAAPNGDVVGMTWSPFTGDRVVSYKWDASEGQWFYAPVQLHTPAFDRPWLAVIPGPITVAGETLPYISLMKGGFPSKEVAYVSFDGLHYVKPDSRVLDAASKTWNVSYLDQPARPSSDFVQPLTESLITPLPEGSALEPRRGTPAPCDGDPFAGVRWRKLGDDLRWRCFGTPNTLFGDRMVVDSRGWLHRFNILSNAAFLELSADGGRSWSTAAANLPSRHTIEHLDFKANGELGKTVLAVHAQGPNSDQDLVYEFDTTTPSPSLEKVYEVGDGDVDSCAGLRCGPIRMDFTTVAILPDGRIATSAIDGDSNGRPRATIQV